MKKSLLLAIQLASHLAYMILIPLFVFGGTGLLADRYFTTTPRYLFIGLAIGFVVTTYWINKQLRNIVAATFKEGK